MSTPPSWQMLLLDPRCIAAEVPPADAGIAESERLRAALCWSFAFRLYQSALPGECTLTLQRGAAADGEVLIAVAMRARSVEDGTEIDVQRIAGDRSLRDLLLVPLHAGQQPRAHARIDHGDAGCTLLLAGDEAHGGFDVRLDGLDATRVATVSPGAGSREHAEPVRLVAPPSIAIVRTDELRIDLLGGDETKPRTLHDHLRRLIDAVFGDAAAITIMLSCGYVSAWPPRSVPVLMVPRSRHARGDIDEFCAAVANEIETWWHANHPDEGALAFGLDVIAEASEPARVSLRLQALRLPQAAIELRGST